MNNILTDAFDHTWVVIGVVYSPLSLVFLLYFASILWFQTLRRKKPIKNYRIIFLTGALLAALQLLHLFAQINDYSVSANITVYTIPEILFGFIGIFSTTAGGLILMKDAGKRIVKIVGLLFSVLPQLLLAGFYFGVITYTNLIFMTSNPVPIFLWNYSGFWMPTIVLLFETSLILAVYHFVI